ncbi:putative Exodeoxyribonuclease V beta chain [Methylocaldum marinum]|uniref:RecBCD enzyme subunit RecB n=1 Tax=Methylocaldum marinum TaxID=1432792 RepID=A0A250KU23_9GAMM|nr:exodeoxyribonuclease V subunit beta [Methylocaldum marinum]BBA34451.1 putative Exodeoxyribonuclease V beta chain [Methylocaldum marinum]
MDPAFEFDVYTAVLAGLNLVEASAGTGKTWTISGLYVRLILELGLSVDQILVVTYTKAATAELRDRIRKRLREVLSAFETGDSEDEFCRCIVDQYRDRAEPAMRRLGYAISGFDEAAVYTIHGFCQRLLNESAFESGMDFDCELMPDETDLLREIVDDFWRSEVYLASGAWAGFLAQKNQSPDVWLSEIQPYVGKPFLKIEAPVVPADEEDTIAGFSRAVLEAAEVWHAQGTAIESLLLDYSGFNRTRIKPESLRSWLDETAEFFGRWPVSALEQTQQPVVLPEVPPLIELPGNLQRLTPEFLSTAVKKGCEPPQHPFFQCCRSIIDADQALRSSFETRLQGLKRRLIEFCNAELEQRKSVRQVVCYNDLLNRLATALDSEHGECLAETVRRRYRAALIDEFQDTDPIQYRIFRRVYGDGGSPVFFVGDPKQAIYGFRGADIFSYLEARSNERIVRRTLKTNQRSERDLIAAVNTLFIRHPSPFLLDAIPYPEVKTAARSRAILDIEGDDTVPFRFLLLPPGQDDQGKEQPYAKGSASRTAALATTFEIARLLNAASEGKARLGERHVDGGDIAVLVSTHVQARLMEDTLTAYGVPSVRQGQENVFSTSEAAELELVLQAVAQPGREPLIKAALATKLMDCTANAIFELQRDEDAWEAVFDRFQAYHHIWLSEGFMPMFRRWFEDARITDHLPKFRDGERRLTNLLHLAELLQVESRKKSSIDTLLGWFGRAIRNPSKNDETALLRLESDAKRVKIVTIHTSKGLEYPMVFCPFLWDGRLRQRKAQSVLLHSNGESVLDLGSAQLEKNRRQAILEEMSENLRLLYVALTRAVYRCYVVWGNVRNGRDKTEGFHSTAMAWLLHGGSATPDDDPPAALETRLLEADTDLIAADIRRFANQASGCVSVAFAETRPVRYQARKPGNDTTLTTRPFRRAPLYPNWRMSSFSGLITGRHSEAPDYDLLPDSDLPEAPGDSIFAFPRGARAGSCLHAILEEWDFACRDSESLGELVRRKLKAHGIDDHWTPTVREAIETALDTPLDESGLRLSDTLPEKRLVEMEFTYVLRGGNSEMLRETLANPGFQFDPRYAEAARLLDFKYIEGYMKGFIDLVFEASGRYYLLDWKSNWLGNTYTDYASDRLASAMAREHYYLQYLIYTVALHRYLEQRLPTYQYETHFGGAYYLFLRGIAPGQKTGVFRDRPNLQLIKTLSALLIGTS